VFLSEFARTPIGSWYGGIPAGAAGTSVDAVEAYVRCLGEVAERYSALSAAVQGVVRPVDPDLMSMFPRCAPDETCPPELKGQWPVGGVTHVETTRLSDGAHIEIPAGFVHLSYTSRTEPRLTFPISTGLAFDPSLEVALWRGICEVAERDALMMAWLHRRCVAELDVRPGGALPDPLADRVQRVQRSSLEARFFDITTDFDVPTACCVLTGERFPHVTVGTACREDMAAACAKALDEAVSTRVAVSGAEDFVPASLDDFGWMDELDHHAQLYAAGYLREGLDFLLDGEAPLVALDEASEQDEPRRPATHDELRKIAKHLDEIGLTVLWTDVTAPELIGHGHVVKVVIPQMIPLSQFHSARWLATPRLLDAEMGFNASTMSFNRYPHPFS
jgi:ribosomal protein S12 methylthiotransferase accessory factor